jgi:hypothetical protein
LQYAITKGTRWYGTLEIHTKNNDAHLAQVALWPVYESTQPNSVGDMGEQHNDDTAINTKFICFLQAYNVSVDIEKDNT